ncbi:MAG: hydroxymethylglutaryl-CoA reductase [Spirochaetes bacterium]|nr:hydroxymethylglutaryl-CoA reductase [Spirochaetota bacterium]
MSGKIPRSPDEDYTRDMAQVRQKYIQEKTGVELRNVGSYSFDPAILKGNIENFFGVSQVPIGLAGPLLVNGEHARGEFYVPLATTEGTLVASYNRGMKLVRESGGVKTTVTDDAMQRAPVFIFDDARAAREFGTWIDLNFTDIKANAEKSTSIGKLRNIEKYQMGKIMFLRFNFTTGDAAGQNMVGKATYFACQWIMQRNQNVRRHALSGNIDTDKKHSLMNTLHSRGKRVTAEVVIPRDLLHDTVRMYPEHAIQMRWVATMGSFMAGSNNNGQHSANGITALFIATGQDVANVAESSSALVYAELTPEMDYYYSITIPSLIVAAYGGGTGLATQRECMEMLGCAGKGNAAKFAEIVAATVICGELSLGAAIMAGDWVSSHEKMGRNR